jgi:TPR repeat protein
VSATSFSAAVSTIDVQGTPGISAGSERASAMKEVRKAADQGDAIAEYYMGKVYETAEGVGQDYVQAETWFARSAAQGFAPGERALGQLYYMGRGVAANYVVAAEWFTKAAEQDDVDAEASLGYMYANGQGVPVNREAAIAWFKKAAAQGDTDSKIQLQKLYAQGEQERSAQIPAALALQIGKSVLLDLSAVGPDPSSASVLKPNLGATSL